MLLIFGGTTEGRIAVDVCDQSGMPFFYSTKSDIQQVDMHHGQRLVGAMTAKTMARFCQKHDIKCIVDAAHPFAETLHRTIAETGLPVIRLERNYGQERQGVIYCDDYAEAVRRLQEHPASKLLALSGANTIAKTKDYWQQHTTYFRILDREESRQMAADQGFPINQLIYYKKDICHTKALPSIDDEKAMMLESGCDAILTKDSGETGGFDAKVDAALQLGLRVYAVRRPQLPSAWIQVTGRHGLRRAIEHMVPEFFLLRTGLTTGACATAAFKAALLNLLNSDMPEEVAFALPDGEVLTIPVDEVGRRPEKDSQEGPKAYATVTKDHSDDPDVTKGCRITAEVSWIEEGDQSQASLNKPQSAPDKQQPASDKPRCVFLQGSGVGRATLPGLGIPVGEPAINETPRQMMENELKQLTNKCCYVTISVEGGKELARQTFNSKVGIIGGISIIGTSGIVSPLSNEAFVQSIRRELEVARAIGCTSIGFASGKKGEDALHEQEPSLRVIHYGNFVGEALKAAYELGFKRAVLAIMIGKAVKLAEGHLDTHSHKVTMNKEFLKQVARETPCTPDEVRALSSVIDQLTMARELWQTMPPAFFERITNLCLQHCRTVFPTGDLTIHLTCDNPQ